MPKMKSKTVKVVKQPKKPVYIKELPDWFDLNNYKDSNKLDLEGWITQIALRKAVEDFFKKIFFTGVVDDFKLLKKDNSENSLTEVHAKAVAPIHNLTLHDAIRIVEVVKHLKVFPPEFWASPSCFDSFSEGHNNETKSMLESLDDLNNTELEHVQYYPLNALYYLPTHTGLLDVDLAVSDKILLSSFKKWLANQRATSGYELSKRTYTKSILRRWATNQVLAYIDLSYWAKIQRVEIPHWLMGEALFSKYQGDKIDRVRKTTKKIADEILHPACLYGMSAQFTHETNKKIFIGCHEVILPGEVEIKNRIFLPA